MGATPDDFVAPYTLSGWEADLAAWQAVTLARPEHEAMVRAAVAALLQPWLDDTSKRFQAAVQSHGLPAPADQPPIAAPSGGCLLFADGLRYDVPRQLQKELEVVGITGSLTTPNGAACFNTGGTYTYAHGGISLQECLTPVLVVSGGTSNAPAAAMRRTVVGGDTWAAKSGLMWSHRRSSHGRSGRKPGVRAGAQDPPLRVARPRPGRRSGGGHLPSQAHRPHHGCEASGANVH
jgi:hypothetical protein